MSQDEKSAAGIITDFTWKVLSFMRVGKNPKKQQDVKRVSEIVFKRNCKSEDASLDNQMETVTDVLEEPENPKFTAYSCITNSFCCSWYFRTVFFKCVVLSYVTVLLP